MAAGILRLKLADEIGWQIGSAGTWAAEGQTVLPEVLEVMSPRGIDLSRHRARTVSEKLLGASNLVLVMESSHHEAIIHEFPGVSSRVFLLSEMSGRWQPVLDPVGGTQKDYQSTADELDRLITQGLERIRYLARME